MNEQLIEQLLDDKKIGVKEAILTIDSFQHGIFKPLVTSFEHLNNICLGGLLPSLIISILARPGHGKCKKKGTKVLMYDGNFKKVEDVVVGDKLMGPDSKSRKVLSLARGREEMYWIRQNKGIDYCVNKSHILSLKKSRQEGSGNKGDVLNISVEDYLKKSDKFKSNYKGYKVDVEFPEKKLEIDPYYLGLWLGDGDVSSCTITNNEPEISEFLENFAKQENQRLVIKQEKSNCKRYSLRGTGKDWHKNCFTNRLREIGVINNKHIPKNYLINSKENRLKLLAGLLDTDGYYCKKDNCFEIVQKNKLLAEQIVFLCNSLGFRVYMNDKISTIKSTGFEGTYYRVIINGNMDIIPNRVERKKGRKFTSKRDWRTTGITVEFDKVDDYYGFELDGDHLYLLEDMTVTHNTYMAHQLREDILADKDANIGLLLYNWEMPFFALLLVQIKKALNKSYKNILSQIPTEQERIIINKVTDKFQDERLTTINRPLTPQEFDILTRRYIERNLHRDQIFIMIDHAGITKGKNKLEVMFELLEIMNNIKLDYANKVTFIVLSQLNRTIENTWRSQNTNPAGLRVTSEFIYNADAIMQFADVVCGLVIPEKGHMEDYTSVNRQHYRHLEEHFSDDGTPSDSIRLKGRNRIYYDYIKVRLPDNDPTLYCSVINPDEEELIDAFSMEEKDYTGTETINF